MIVHAYHGWASDPSIWDWLQTFIGQNNVVHRYDRGYFGGKNHINLEEQPDVIVTHSMGLMFVPANVLANATFLVVLNGFAFFPSNDQATKRKTTAMLGRMKLNLQKDPHVQVEAFCTAAGMHLISRSHPTINVNQLSADLDLLSTAKVIPNEVCDQAVIHFLHSTNDPIVNPAAISETVSAFSNATHHYIESSSHNLTDHTVEAVLKRIFGR